MGMFQRFISTLASSSGIPPWLSILLCTVGAGLTVYAEPISNMLGGSGTTEVTSYIPVVPELDLHTTLKEVEGDAISVWSISYFVPESATMQQSVNTVFDVAHINTYKVALHVFAPQIAAHTSQQCYVGSPLIHGYELAGVKYTINCPLTYEVGSGRKLMIGFTSVMYRTEPTDIQIKLSTLNKLSRKVTAKKEE